MDDTSYSDELLIIAVEDCAHLYDKRNEHFLNEPMKQNSWMAIGHKFHIDGELAKKRWLNLRDRFVRAHRAMVAHHPSGFGTPKAKFSLYNKMLWLAPHVRKQRLNISAASVSSTSTQDDKMQVCPKRELLFVDTSDLFHEYSSDDQTSPPPAAESKPVVSLGLGVGVGRVGSSCSTCASGSSKIQQMQQDGFIAAVNTFAKYYDEKRQRLCESTTSPTGNESDLYFMKSIAADMDMLSPINKITFKQEVMALLAKYVKRQLE